MRAIATGLLLVLAASTSGCALLRTGPSARRAGEIVDRAVEMAEAGEVAAAIEHVEAEFGPEQEPGVAFRRHFALGWLHDVLAEETDDEAQRASELEQAASHYREALALRPGDADSSDNLAGVLRSTERYREAIDVLEAVPEDLESEAGREAAYARRLAIGDLWLETEDLDTALGEYRIAHAEILPMEEAPLRVVTIYSLFAEGREGWEPALEAECRAFAETGTPHVARRGYELLTYRSLETGDVALGTRALEAWVRLESEASTLSSESLARLPPLSVWPSPELSQLHRLVAFAEQGPPVVKETNGGSSHAERITLEVADLSEWLLTTPARRQIIVLAMKSLALRRTVAGDHLTAAELYWFALRQAPPFELYEPGGTLADERPIAFLDIAPDLAVLLQNHTESVAATGITLHDVLVRVRPPFEGDDGARILAVDPAALQRFHTVFGLIYAERGAWSESPFDDPWKQAPPHLRRAMEVARHNPDQPIGANGQPLPHLARVLAEGLARTTDGHEAAVHAYLGAAVGYFDLDDRALSRSSLERGDELAQSLALMLDDDVEDTERILGIRHGGFFPRGWLDTGFFITAGAMYFDSRLDGRDVDEELSGLGHTTQTSYDGREFGGKVVIGHQFEGPFAIELGYTNMGEIKSDITAFAPVSASLAADLARVHPVLGDGFTLALRTNVWGGGPFTVTARAGAWAWDADKDLKIYTPPAGVQISKIDAEGFDLFYGVGLILGDWRGFNLVVEYERYFLESDAVDSFTLGATHSFGN
jgi:tetratricopeptide (TPR) repeat protein